MNLLASSLTYQNKIILICLCIAILVFAVINILLVLSLHRHNVKLAKKMPRKQRGDEVSENETLDELPEDVSENMPGEGLQE